MPAGADPLWRPEAPPDGRWQRGEVVEGFYLANSADTAWAEWYRALAEFGLPPHRSLPRDLWALRLDVTLADLSTAEKLAAVGLGAPRPSRSDWSTYQAVGEALAADGFNGLIAPSAARPAALVVCLFRKHREDGGLRGVTPLPPPEQVSVTPTPPRGMTT